MGRWLTLKLKKQFCDEKTIKAINADLMGNFNCPSQTEFVDFVFNTRESIQDDVNFMNSDPEGLRQMPHVARPITHEILQSLVIKSKDYGYVEIKLSGGVSENEARTAFALALWAKAEENCNYIDERHSSNYDFETVENYCSYALPGGVYIPIATATPETQLSVAVQPKLIADFEIQPSLF